ncbi:hypothetical protein HGA91_00925 [candidate division WWE3 bacterium]|nr:hypothetical protein [candidate division WWE3 bacterium]
MNEPKIIPAILVQTVEEFIAQFRQVEQETDTVQLDYIDGRFAPIRTCCDADLLGEFEIAPQLEIQLMVENPLIYVDEWIQAGAKRLIGHIEHMPDQDDFVNQIVTSGVEAGLALNIETPLDMLKPELIEHLDVVLLMAHEIGIQGAQFNLAVLDKIRTLRNSYPHLNIEVDGGLNEESIISARNAGANFFAVGSGIFAQAHPAQALRHLQEVIV